MRESKKNPGVLIVFLLLLGKINFQIRCEVKDVTIY